MTRKIAAEETLKSHCQTEWREPAIEPAYGSFPYTLPVYLVIKFRVGRGRARARASYV